MSKLESIRESNLCPEFAEVLRKNNATFLELKLGIEGLLDAVKKNTIVDISDDMK